MASFNALLALLIAGFFGLLAYGIFIALNDEPTDWK